MGQLLIPQRSGNSPGLLSFFSLPSVVDKVNTLKLQVFWYVMASCGGRVLEMDDIGGEAGGGEEEKKGGEGDQKWFHGVVLC